MQFEHRGITLSIGEDEIQRLLLERLAGHEPPVFREALRPPVIGTEWLGGVYAGVVRGIDGQPDCYLIAGPEYDGHLDWPSALAYAKTVKVHGFADFSLPRRSWQAVAFGNIPTLFKPESYWSCEQRALDGVYAWVQDFGDGGQDDWLKSTKLRVRVFRSVPIQ